MKAIPVIFNISSNTGYTNGGQNLTIYGHGFNSDNISVTVDGVDCIVSYYKEDSVSCEVQSKSAPSVHNVSQLGSHGLLSRFLNYSDKSEYLHLDKLDNDDYLYTEKSLRLNFEVQSNRHDTVDKGEGVVLD